METSRKGTFIVLDGNDGSGKATQAELLIQALAQKGIPAEKMDFPGYERNFFGQLVGECLAGKHGDFLHLDPKIASSLYALDRLESSPAITTALEEGKVVIADRFASSNQIHQGGKIADEGERTAFLTWLDRMEHEVLGIPRPDLIVYLAVPVEISLELLSQKRAAKNSHMETEGKDVVEEDRTYLDRSHATARWLLGNQTNWRAVECANGGAMRTREAIHEDVLALVEELL
jgi:dTMP kinase